MAYRYLCCILVFSLGFCTVCTVWAANDRRGRYMQVYGEEPTWNGKRLDILAGQVDTPPVRKLIDEYRESADFFVFLSGGASKMSDEALERLLGLFDAFRLLAERGNRFAVADGGTRAGIMEASGLARQASGDAFLVLGISPGPEITLTGEEGKTEADPNHSHIIGVFNPPWLVQQKQYGWEPSWVYWGSETVTMYEVFSRLDSGRPSLTIVANGGGITLDEVQQNLEQRRRMVVIKGSGRGADAIVSLLEGTQPTDAEVIKRREKAQKIGVLDHPNLFTVFPIERGPRALADLIEEMVGR